MGHDLDARVILARFGHRREFTKPALWATVRTGQHPLATDVVQIVIHRKLLGLAGWWGRRITIFRTKGRDFLLVVLFHRLLRLQGATGLRTGDLSAARPPISDLRTTSFCGPPLCARGTCSTCIALRPLARRHPTRRWMRAMRPCKGGHQCCVAARSSSVGGGAVERGWDAGGCRAFGTDRLSRHAESGTLDTGRANRPAPPVG